MQIWHLIEPALIGAIAGYLLYGAGLMFRSPEPEEGRKYEDAFDWEVPKPSPYPLVISCAIIAFAASLVLP